MVLVPRTGGITRAFHEKIQRANSFLAQIGKHRIGVSYLDESKARVLQVDDHASGHRGTVTELYPHDPRRSVNVISH
jgi:hypothetical protein